MPREGRDIDLALLLLSSQNENADADNRFFIRKPTESSVNRYIREKRFKSFINDVTSTTTAYAFNFVTVTRTLSVNFAADLALSCIPYGFKICN